MAREMKDSGFMWVGQIPKEWTKRRLRYLCDIQTGNQDTQDRDPDGAYPFYVRSPIVERSNKYTFEGSAILMAGDGVGAGRIFHLVDGRYGCHQRVYSLQNIRDINRKFLYYYLSNLFPMEIEIANSKSTVDSVRLPMLQNFQVVIPDIYEQEQIVNFLDLICTEIDTVIEKTKMTIEEYKKLKQSVITDAVTKGVRGSRQMKDSGIELVGSIPTEIKISRVGLHYDIILGKMLCTTPPDESYTLEPYYCAADIHFEGVADGERKQMWFNPAEKEQYLVQENDLLVVEGGAGAGGCAVVRMQDTPTYIQNSIMIVRPRHSASVSYLRYLIECFVKQGYIDVVCNKATIPHFTKDKLATVPFFVFSQAEQKEIADYLDKKCAEIDALIDKKTTMLKEMENYKKSIIYEYVTGKKEVKNH